MLEVSALRKVYRARVPGGPPVAACRVAAA